jgi:hypothetical protein
MFRLTCSKLKNITFKNSLNKGLKVESCSIFLKYWNSNKKMFKNDFLRLIKFWNLKNWNMKKNLKVKKHKS